MILNYFMFPWGMGRAAWRFTDYDAFRHAESDRYVRIAQLIEAAGFHGFFLSDSIHAHPELDRPAYKIEPSLMIAAMAEHTKHLGFIMTSTAVLRHPFDNARLLAQLRAMTKDRLAWNVVATQDDWNWKLYGLRLPSREARYEAALEHIEQVQSLLDQARDETHAIHQDREQGVFLNRELERSPIQIKGKYWSTYGRLTLPYPFQAPLPIFGAGNLNPITCKVARGVFVRTQKASELASLKGRFKEAGAQVKLMPGLIPIVASDRAAGIEEMRRLTDGIQPSYATVVGTPEQIVDRMLQFRAAGAAGFNIATLSVPDHLERFCEEVMPLLHEQGLLPRKPFTNLFD